MPKGHDRGWIRTAARRVGSFLRRRGGNVRGRLPAPVAVAAQTAVRSPRAPAQHGAQAEYRRIPHPHRPSPAAGLRAVPGARLHPVAPYRQVRAVRRSPDALARADRAAPAVGRVVPHRTRGRASRRGQPAGPAGSGGRRDPLRGPGACGGGHQDEPRGAALAVRSTAPRRGRLRRRLARPDPASEPRSAALAGRPRPPRRDDTGPGAGQGRVGPGRVRVPREAGLHRDRSSVAAGGHQAVGRRGPAAAPGPQCPEHLVVLHQFARRALREPGCAARRPRRGARAPRARRHRRVHQPPGVPAAVRPAEPGAPYRRAATHTHRHFRGPLGRG